MMTTLPCVRIRRCRIPEGTEVGELIYFCVEEFLSTGVGGVYLWAKKPKTVGDIACHSHTLLSASSGVPSIAVHQKYILISALGLKAAGTHG